jgi:biopolymer transport protein ExbD
MAKDFGLPDMQLDEGINLTPLLDVLFNLIFFFILATTIKDREAFLDVTLPDAQQSAAASETKPTWTIVLTADQRVLLNGEDVEADALADRLAETPPEDIDGIVVRGDTKAYHGTLVKALDACARSGQTNIRIEVAPRVGNGE